MTYLAVGMQLLLRLPLRFSNVDFIRPTLFRDVQAYIKTCDRCQRVGKLPKTNAMPMAPILAVDIFDV